MSAGNYQYRIAMTGQPNCGKSTMFNAITGSTARVGNYPGITVERMEGCYRKDDCRVKIIDLPGTYSLTSYSMEELVARNVIVDERPDAVICMLDTTALERSLYLAVQLMEIGAPIVIGLNMMDEVRKKGIHIDSAKLSELLQVPIVECTAKRGIGKDELITRAIELARNSGGKWRPKVISYGADIDKAIEEMAILIEANNFMTGKYFPRWLAIKYIEQDEEILKNGSKESGGIHARLQDIVQKITKHTESTAHTYPEAIIADYRYGYINSVIKQGVMKREAGLAYDISDKVDKFLTQRLLGPLIMLGVLYALFYLTFTIGAYPQGWMEDGFEFLGYLGRRFIPDGLVQSLIVDGIISGVGAVLSFTPLILIMFGMLVFLEDLGYMARVAYMLDRVFRAFGLHGASVMPFIISGGIPGGCAVPGVMTARTLRSPKERLATIFTAPMMICGAKTTVFLMLSEAFFPGHATRVMFILTIATWIFALLAARLLRWTVIRGAPTPFVMELPPYRMPTMYGVIIHTWDRVWQFVKKAGTVIFAISVIMWVLMTFPQLPKEREVEFSQQINQAQAKQESLFKEGKINEKQRQANLEKVTARINGRRDEAALKYSIAGKIGSGMETVTQYAGFPWQLNISLFGGFAAKEVIISTLSTAYAMGGGDVDEGSDRQTLFAQKLLADRHWTMPAIISAFFFMLFYAPCSVTVVTIVRESSWTWAIFTTVASVIVTFIISVLIFQAGSLIA